MVYLCIKAYLYLTLGNLGFPCGSAGKESAYNAGDLGSIPGLGRSHGEGKGYPLQYSGLENSMDCIVHGAAKSQTQLNDFHFLLGNLDLIFNIYTIPILKLVYKTQYLALFKCLSVKYLISITLFSTHPLDGG